MEKEEDFPKLPLDFKARWLEALRSGRYVQTTSQLYEPREEEYCCLGVAVHICGISNEEMAPYSCIIEGLPGIEKVPDILRGDADSTPLLTKLIDMNDQELKTFPQIADWIEERL